jgi:BASS family bile acid:Na+ symporter
MDLKQLVILALQVSVIATVFGFGLNATSADLLNVLRRPGLLTRALLAVFVVMPLVAVALVRWFGFPSTVEVVLIALAISPVPPLLPRREGKAGGDRSFALGLMAVLGLVSIVAVPATIATLQWAFRRSFVMPMSAVVALVLKTTIVPLGVGMLLRAMVPDFANRLAKTVSIVARILLPIAALVLLAGTASAIWAASGPGTILALTLFVLAGLAVGHLLGGPDPDRSVVLALSTACRHPAIALTIAAANFPDQRFGGTILLYLILNAILAIPYVQWQKKAAAQAVAPG